jgi:hypothetical protein
MPSGAMASFTHPHYTLTVTLTVMTTLTVVDRQARRAGGLRRAPDTLSTQQTVKTAH